MKKLIFLFVIFLTACTTASYDHEAARTQIETALEIQLPAGVTNSYFLQETRLDDTHTWMRFDVSPENANELFSVLGFPNLTEQNNPELTGIFVEPEGENTEWWYEWHDIERLLPEQRFETPYVFQIKVDARQADAWTIYYLRADVQR